MMVDITDTAIAEDPVTHVSLRSDSTFLNVHIQIFLNGFILTAISYQDIGSKFSAMIIVPIIIIIITYVQDQKL
jgi:hypothetical protein